MKHFVQIFKWRRLLHRRIYDTIIAFFLHIYVLAMSILYLSNVADTILGEAIGIIISFPLSVLLIATTKRRISDNVYHYNRKLNIIFGLIVVALILLQAPLLISGAVEVDIDIVATFILLPGMVSISWAYLGIIIWLFRYEKTHGTIYIEKK